MHCHPVASAWGAALGAVAGVVILFAPPPPFARAARADDPAAAAAPVVDTVTLKDGRVLKGTVDDRGEVVIVTCRGPGNATIELRLRRIEISSIELGGGAQQPREDLDIVVLLSGDEIAGRVEVRKGGREVAVVLGGDKASGELKLDQRQVKEILWSQRAADDLRRADRGGIPRTVEELLETHVRGDAAAKAKARDELFALGVFALPYLEVRRHKVDAPDTLALIEDVLAAATARTFTSSYLVERIPDLARRVVDPAVEVRLSALKEAVITSPRDAVPLLVHRVELDPAPEVRAFVLGQLSLQGRVRELVELCERTEDPKLKFSAALALGDNGVYVGIPVLLEGLAHASPEIRTLSGDALKRWTGQSLGYFAEGLPGEDADTATRKRTEAVARWEAWFAKDGQALVDASVRATLRRELVTEDDMASGQAHWLDAQVRWSEILEEGLDGEARKDAFEAVRWKLVKAIEAYPHFVNARLALAELCYSELGDLEGARREVDVALRRYADEGGAATRKLGHYHLGAIARLERNYAEAFRQLKLASTIDPADFRVLAALGEVHYDRAIQEATNPAERRTELEASLRIYAEALERIAQYQKDVEGSKEAADAVAGEDNPFARGPFLAKLEALTRQVRFEEGETHFRIARSHAALQQDDKALASYRRAHELCPGNLSYEAAARIWAERVRVGAAAPTAEPSPAPPAPAPAPAPGSP